MFSRMIFTFCVVALLACCSVSATANDRVAASYGILLAPGEVLVAVNGVYVTDDRPLLSPVRTAVRATVNTVDRLQEVFPVLDRSAIRATRQCYRDARGVMRCGN